MLCHLQARRRSIGFPQIFSRPASDICMCVSSVGITHRLSRGFSSDICPQAGAAGRGHRFISAFILISCRFSRFSGVFNRASAGAVIWCRPSTDFPAAFLLRLSAGQHRALRVQIYRRFHSGICRRGPEKLLSAGVYDVSMKLLMLFHLSIPEVHPDE